MLTALRENRVIRQFGVVVVIIAAFVGLIQSCSYYFEQNRIAYENSPEGRAEAARAQDQSDIEVAETVAKTQLRDPASAQFAATVSHRYGARLVCGAVNGRNGLGGMAGYQSFIYSDKIGFKWVGASEEAVKLSDRYCL